MRLAVGEFLTRHAADQPGVAGEVVVDAREEIRRAPLWPPAAGKRPAVDRRAIRQMTWGSWQALFRPILNQVMFVMQGRPKED